MRRLVIAGLHSGVGKTTVVCALLTAWRDHGWRVQPFKVGPDYIDPSHHEQAAGRISRNLDSVLLPAPVLQRLFAKAAETADVSVVEGVMGLFDGRNDSGEVGSTAHVAKLIQAPVVVVIDVGRMGRTAGAVARGCLDFDPTLEVAGFILNRVASPVHERITRAAIEEATGRPVVGALPRDESLGLPERHLGLVPAAEHAFTPELRARLINVAREHLDLDRLWAIAGRSRTPPLPNPPPRGGEGTALQGVPYGEASAVAQQRVMGAVARRRVTIAVARDAAFSFYYEDSLDQLREAGADLVPFSPLVDDGLPAGVQGVYVGGGFPEMFAAQLADNRPLHAALRRAVEAGVPMYGECGGLMYLGRSLDDFEGARHTMAGAIPLESVMQRRRATLGYRTATAVQPNLLLAGGAQVVGHEFHYSHLSGPLAPEQAAYRLREAGDALEGYAVGNVLASYVHLHFASHPDLARRFVEACARVAPV